MTIVFHASYCEVRRPDVLHSRRRLDFGRGFYVTPIRRQAERWAGRMRLRAGRGMINVYRFDDGGAESRARVLRFPGYDAEWLDFIAACRRGGDVSEAYDVIIGGIANDKVFDTVELFFDGLITRDAALGRLRVERPNLQICLKNQKTIDAFLSFRSCGEFSDAGE